MRSKFGHTKKLSHVPQEDHEDRPIPLHGGNVDDEVDGIDPPIGGVEDVRPEGGLLNPQTLQEVELDRHIGDDQDEVDERHQGQSCVHFLGRHLNCHIVPSTKIGGVFLTPILSKKNENSTNSQPETQYT